MYEDNGDTFTLTCELGGCGETVTAPAQAGRRFPGVPGWLSVEMADLSEGADMTAYPVIPVRRYDFCPGCAMAMVEKLREMEGR